MSAYDAERVREIGAMPPTVLTNPKVAVEVMGLLLAASERIERLERALEKYGNHLDGECDAIESEPYENAYIYTGRACTCGLDAALSTDQGGE